MWRDAGLRPAAARETAPRHEIEGVCVRPLTVHADFRGSAFEMFRAEWEMGVAPVQWTALASGPGVLRGPHVHPRHTDYCVLVSGRCTMALHDLRPGSPSQEVTRTFELRGEEPMAVTIPNGVLHGFLYHAPSVHLVGLSHPYDPDDDLGCRWDDPELGIPWPCEPAVVSDRDLASGSLAALREALARRLRPV